MRIKAIAFDAYGTVCQIGKPTKPYRALAESHSNPELAARILMTQNRGAKRMAALFSRASITVPKWLATLWQQMSKARAFLECKHYTWTEKENLILHPREYLP